LCDLAAEGLIVSERVEESLDTDEVTETPKAQPLVSHRMNGRSHNPSHSCKNGHARDRNSGSDRQNHLPKRSGPAIYGALDLGTNNCRLLVARPSRRGFQVIDAFSRIIRLGEGVSQTGRLSDAAIERTLDALKVCSDKLARREVRRSRLIATEACRIATNGQDFVQRVQRETGLRLEVVSRETEARLAVAGCASLLDASCDYALVFDIGGGSTELIWVDLRKLEHRPKRHRRSNRSRLQNAIVGWTSMPVGVVTMAERFGGKAVDEALFEAMVSHVVEKISPFRDALEPFGEKILDRTHLLGTSGTVTTIAGIHLKLACYMRSRVDGVWLNECEIRRVSRELLGLSYQERSLQPCIGPDRADLVLGGCAILEGIMRLWPCQRLRVADRGLREGILMSLMSEDQRNRSGQGTESR
jgi:exopolyphosphatase/guanosine-5'-triphosphate,3'-diphosphate pyrophosphatase